MSPAPNWSRVSPALACVVAWTLLSLSPAPYIIVGTTTHHRLPQRATEVRGSSARLFGWRCLLLESHPPGEPPANERRLAHTPSCMTTASSTESHQRRTVCQKQVGL